MHKGSDKIKISIEAYPDAVGDEYRRFELLRYVSAGEAIFRFLEMRLHYSDVTCELITIHTEGDQYVTLGPDGGELRICTVLFPPPRPRFDSQLLALTEVDEEVAERAHTYTSQLHRYFSRMRMPINILALKRRGVRHTDDILICDYFRYFTTSDKLPLSLKHLADSHGVPYAAPPPDLEGDGAAVTVDGDDDDGADIDDDDAVDIDRRSRVNYRNIREIHRDDAVFPYPKHYVWPRPRRCVTRLPAFSPVHGERYFLRLLLLNVPAYSFEELRTFAGVTYANFSGAAVARGLVPQGDEARVTMSAIAADIEADPAMATPASLRSIFCIYCIHNRDAIQPEEAFDEFWRQMSLDFKRPGWRPGTGDSRVGLTDNLLKALLVRELGRWMSREGRAISEFLPTASRIEAELLSREESRLLLPEARLVSEHRNAQSRVQAQAEFDSRYAKATADQRVIIDYWIATVTDGGSPQIFIDALAGRGKTFVMSEYEAATQTCTS